MSVRSAVGFKGGDIPTGNQDLQQVLENGNDAEELSVINLANLECVTINSAPPSAPQDLVSVLIQGEDAGLKNIVNVNNIEVASINGINLIDRSFAFQLIASQSIVVTANVQFNIPLPVPVSLPNGGYIVNALIQMSTSNVFTINRLRIFIGGVQITESAQRADNASGFTIMTFAIPAFPFVVSGGPLALTITAETDANSTININGGASGASFVSYNKVYANIPPPPPTPQWNWSARAENLNWTSICCNSSGSILAGTSSPSGKLLGYIYTSSNFGTNWTLRSEPGSKSWAGICSNGVGDRLVAVAFNEFIYTSLNSGVTWVVNTTTGIQNWEAVASNDTGDRLVAVVNPGFIYTSSNFGATWTANTTAGSKNWYSVASNTVGDRLVAIVKNGFIYTSSDFGATWVEQTLSTNRAWEAVASNGVGDKLVAVVKDGFAYTSIDFGVNWIEETSIGVESFDGCASNATGDKLALSVYAGYLYTSGDFGLSWESQNNAGVKSWNRIVSNSAGDRLATTVVGGQIYTGVFA